MDENRQRLALVKRKLFRPLDHRTPLASVLDARPVVKFSSQTVVLVVVDHSDGIGKIGIVPSNVED